MNELAVSAGSPGAAGSTRRQAASLGSPTVRNQQSPQLPRRSAGGGLSHVCVILQVGQQGHRSGQDPNRAGLEGSAGAHGEWSFQGHRHVVQNQLYALERPGRARG